MYGTSKIRKCSPLIVTDSGTLGITIHASIASSILPMAWNKCQLRITWAELFVLYKKIKMIAWLKHLTKCLTSSKPLTQNAAITMMNRERLLDGKNSEKIVIATWDPATPKPTSIRKRQRMG